MPEIPGMNPTECFHSFLQMNTIFIILKSFPSENSLGKLLTSKMTALISALASTETLPGFRLESEVACFPSIQGSSRWSLFSPWGVLSPFVETRQ